MTAIDDLYVNILGRPKTEADGTFWDDAYASGTSLESISNSFRASEEYTSKNTPAEETTVQSTVQPLVQSQASTDNEFATGSAADPNGGNTVGDFRNNIGTTQFTPNTEIAAAPIATPIAGVTPTNTRFGDQSGQLATLYKDALGRDLGTEGQAYWQGELDRGIPWADVEKAIRESPEAVQYQTNGTSSVSLGDGPEVLTAKFNQIFGRDPTPQELTSYRAAGYTASDLSNTLPGKTALILGRPPTQHETDIVGLYLEFAGGIPDKLAVQTRANSGMTLDEIKTAILSDANRVANGGTTSGGLATGNFYSTTSEARENLRGEVGNNLSNPTDVLSNRNLEQEYTNLEPGVQELLSGVFMDFTTLDPAKQAEYAGAIDAAKYKYEATVLGKQETSKAIEELNAQSPMKAASMVEELTNLVGELENGVIPQWAKPAVTKVEQMLASRGISASSVGRDALFNAIITAAMPLAQQDSMYKQEAEKVNYQARVQAIFSDSSVENARLQFNATSENQTKQFMASLQSQVDLQNATRKEVISQFNAGQENDFSKVQASFDHQRAQFNAQMGNVVEQSNVTWRRQVNQINTAGVNAVNQANVQNAFNLSNQALSLLWQEMRDEATFAFKASESAADRIAQVEAAIMATESAAGGQIGVFMKNALDASKIWNTVVSGVNS